MGFNFEIEVSIFFVFAAPSQLSDGKRRSQARLNEEAFEARTRDDTAPFVFRRIYIFNHGKKMVESHFHLTAAMGLCADSEAVDVSGKSLFFFPRERKTK